MMPSNKRHAASEQDTELKPVPDMASNTIDERMLDDFGGKRPDRHDHDDDNLG